MSRRIVIAVVAAVVAVAVAVPLGLRALQERADRELRAAAEGFANAWRGQRLAVVTFATGTAEAAAAEAQRITGGLTTAEVDAPRAAEVRDVRRDDSDDDRAAATLAVTWALPGGADWSYETRLGLVRSGDGWRPEWSPQIMHPGTRTGDTLRTDRVTAARGRILAAGGEAIVEDRPVVVVGIQPGRTGDVAASAAAIAAAVGVDAAALTRRAAAAADGAFVEAITLRAAAYAEVRDRLRPIPGAVFREEQRSLAPTAGFARALLGTVGPATAEIVTESRGRVQAGDLTGLSGLQRSLDTELAGTAGTTVRRLRAGADPETLFEVAPVPGTDVTTTLDPDVQVHAEAALEGAPKPAALVAVRAGTGDVLAVANGGPDAAGYNRALLGRYPPGSTFKVASGLAILGSGVTPDTTVACPATITVSGRRFRNAEGEVLGTVPFRRDFADSCNTAFIGNAERVSPDALAAAARSLGYGREPDLGTEAYGGQVPTSAEPVAHAAAMIGQGTVLASPLVVASASAAVAAGAYAPPRLVLDDSAAATPPPSPATEPLPAGPAGNLRQLMREVVTSGTGTALRDVPGGPVAGKTGTAEYGTATPPRTHAWFTGFQGDVAFAVIVEDGGFGGAVAAPVAADFLRRLAAS